MISHENSSTQDTKETWWTSSAFENLEVVSSHPHSSRMSCLYLSLMFKFAIGLLDFPIKTWVGQQLQRTREPPPLKTGSWTWRSISWNERRNDGKRGKMATGQLVDFRWSFRIFLIAIQEMIQFASVLSTWVEEKNPPTWYIYIYLKQKQEIPFPTISSSVWMLNFRGA